MRSNASDLVSGGRKNKAAVNISEANWGYIIRAGIPARSRASFGELAALAGCIIFGFFAFGLWTMPGSTSSAELFPIKIGITVVFFVISAWLYLMARRGFTTEVQIDIKRQEVRLAQRNREGESSLVERFGFEEIDSVYMKRTKSEFSNDHLFLNLREAHAAVPVASALTVELEPLLERLRVDLNGNATRAANADTKPSLRDGKSQARGAFGAR